MKLVSEWNIPEIKKRGTNSNMLPDDPICAIKIVFIKGRYYIDCVYFKDFSYRKRYPYHRIMYPTSTYSYRKAKRMQRYSTMNVISVHLLYEKRPVVDKFEKPVFDEVSKLVPGNKTKETGFQV